jgi:hypothetical protein
MGMKPRAYIRYEDPEGIVHRDDHESLIGAVEVARAIVRDGCPEVRVYDRRPVVSQPWQGSSFLITLDEEVVLG